LNNSFSFLSSNFSPRFPLFRSFALFFFALCVVAVLLSVCLPLASFPQVLGLGPPRHRQYDVGPSAPYYHPSEFPREILRGGAIVAFAPSLVPPWAPSIHTLVLAPFLVFLEFPHAGSGDLLLVYAVSVCPATHGWLIPPRWHPEIGKPLSPGALIRFPFLFPSPPLARGAIF
jgi:hypothetical protein